MAVPPLFFTSFDLCRKLDGLFRPEKQDATLVIMNKFYHMNHLLTMCAHCNIIWVMLKYVWDQQKNELLISTRGISFQDVLEQINKKEVLGDLPHHNHIKYPNQRLYILCINNYVCIVPYVRVKNTITFKTIYKSRKLNKLFKEQYDKTKK